MKKRLALSLIALFYIIAFKITDFETGEVAFATILMYIGVPCFILVSLILLIISFKNFYIEKFKIKSLNFATLILNVINIVLNFNVLLFFLNPINW